MLALTVLGFGVVACGPAAPEEEQALKLDNMDQSVKPADDFFQYVNGGWIEKTEIPAEEGRWGSFNELRKETSKTVLDVLSQAAESGKYEAGTDQMKAADFYAVGMDSTLAERAGLRPLQSWLDKIDQIEGAQDLESYLIESTIYGGGGFFNFAVLNDLMNSKEMAAYLVQGGLGLPNKDYYTKQDERSKEIRAKYVSHVARMLGLMGEEQAQAKAEAIMELEYTLAEASMTPVEQRNIPALYNKMSIAELSKKAPGFDWDKYLNGIGAADQETIIVMQPKFMAAFADILKTVPVSNWQAYLKWNALNSMSNFLNNEIVAANFDFYGKELGGLQEMRPRWQRVLGTTNGALGEAIGKLYVDEAFPPEAKAKAKEMVENILASYEERIKGLDWMSDSTKQQALTKLSTFTVKIGYPDKWRDYSGLEMSSGTESSSFAQNVMNANKFNFEYQVSQLGKPVDKAVWGMSPQTVNAYYNPLFNEIVFPAAILQPPFYNYKADAAVNYGGVGAVIGHEISHGFDDQGSRFDSEGNLKNWWSEQDLANFRSRTAKMIDQFNKYEPLDSVFVNGQLTLGENIGDLGGIAAAFDGLMKDLTKYGDPGLIDGYTQQQRFFLSWATIWRMKYRDESLRTQVLTDPHSPGMYRANGPLSNFEEFYKAFDVKPGDAMYRADSARVKIW